MGADGLHRGLKSVQGELRSFLGELVADRLDPQTSQSVIQLERRQEVIGEPRRITVLDDFAHHPTAVKVTLEALRLLKPKVALPNHYDTWPPIAQDAAVWAGAVAAARLATPHVLVPGASFVVK